MKPTMGKSRGDLRVIFSSSGAIQITPSRRCSTGRGREVKAPVPVLLLLLLLVLCSPWERNEAVAAHTFERDAETHQDAIWYDLPLPLLLLNRSPSIKISLSLSKSKALSFPLPFSLWRRRREKWDKNNSVRGMKVVVFLGFVFCPSLEQDRRSLIYLFFFQKKNNK